MAPPLDSAIDSSDPFEGTKYRSISILGKGGMGAAHVVEHRLLGTHFVCKVLRGRHRNNPGAADRMRVEAQSLARLVHPNIVKVFDFDFTQDGRPFIVMERLQGHTLGQELLNRGELPTLEAIDIARQLLSALSVAHALGIVHRDIKLDNLFLHYAGSSRPTLKVLDFGVAKIIDGISEFAPPPPQIPTRAGAIIGTPRFLSPEAASGKSVDQRADVYGASVVLYMLLCGRGPWDDASSHASVFSAQANKVLIPPSKFAKNPIDADLESIVLTAMSKDPDERFQTAKAFDAALSTVAERLLVGVRMGSSRPPPPVLQQHAILTGSDTLRLLDEQRTETALPDRGALARVPRNQMRFQLMAFTVSACASATVTWWCLTFLFHQ